MKDDDGSYMSTMVAVQNVKEVSGEFEVPAEHATEPAPPARRVTGKAHLSKLDAQSEVDDDESCCKAAFEDGKFTLADCSDLLMSLHVRNPVGVCVKDQQQVASVSLGMSATEGEPTRPWLTRYLNEALVRTMPEGAYYTNLEVLYNGGNCLGRRRDCEPGTKCYAIMLGDHVGGDMWVEMKDNETSVHPIAWRQFHGRWHRGQVVPSHGRCCSFDVDRLYAPLPHQGDQVAILAYVRLTWQAVDRGTRPTWQDAGFPMPKMPEVRSLREGGEGHLGEKMEAQFFVLQSMVKFHVIARATRLILRCASAGVWDPNGSTLVSWRLTKQVLQHERTMWSGEVYGLMTAPQDYIWKRVVKRI